MGHTQIFAQSYMVSLGVAVAARHGVQLQWRRSLDTSLADQNVVVQRGSRLIDEINKYSRAMRPSGERHLLIAVRHEVQQDPMRPVYKCTRVFCGCCVGFCSVTAAMPAQKWLITPGADAHQWWSLITDFLSLKNPFPGTLYTLRATPMTNGKTQQ